jgi:uncharacterized membrane protein (UPF0127 family)
VIPDRLARLEEVATAEGRRVFVAWSPRARLLGLAWLDELPLGCALLIPRCRSVHTFGMRFALDVDFLDADGRAIHCVRGVPPRRLAWCRGAAAVLERPAAKPARRGAATA